jgi:hypothetical protein
MDRSLFVAHEDMLDGVLLEEGVVDMEYGTARIAPDVLDAFGLQ